jgi:prepilin-type N-terminal cleavage/methylation domain-containing protein
MCLMRLGERTPVAENGQDGLARVLGMARELLGCTGGMVRRTLRSRAGFTLVELVMVLVILAILLSLALPSYLGAKRKAYFSEAGEKLQEMREAAWAHYLAHGTFTGFPNQPSPSTRYWTFAYETCAATKCTLTAKGNDNTPVEGAKVVVVLSADGTSRFIWEGF